MVNHYIPSLDGDDYVKEAIINQVDSVGMGISRLPVIQTILVVYRDNHNNSK